MNESIKKQIEKIRFTFAKPSADRVYHITAEDIKVVLSRIPHEHWNKLREVHFNDSSQGARSLGYVTTGKREISVAALPPRISFTRFLVKGQTPEEFGAVRGAQWPKLAIRRFLLYDVFLHELGHLQVVDEKAKSESRRYAREGKAQEFAIYWGRKLWQEHFSHHDPVHNKPTKQEIAEIKATFGIRN
jgi:hypothetical protein